MCMHCCSALVRHLFPEPILGGCNQSVDHGHAHVGLHLLCQPGAHIRQVSAAQAPNAAHIWASPEILPGFLI